MSRFNVRVAPAHRIREMSTSLGRGEREVLSLACESHGCLVLLDDALARLHARRLGLRLTGTLGILLKGKQSGLLTEIRPILDKLEIKGFRLDKKTRFAVMKLAQEF